MLYLLYLHVWGRPIIWKKMAHSGLVWKSASNKSMFLFIILLLTFWHWKWKSLIRHVNRVIIFSLEPAARRCEICQCGIGSQSMTQIFVPQPCQLHLSSGPRRCGGAGVEERWSCQRREWQRSLSLLGVGVTPLGSPLLLFSSWFEAHVTGRDFSLPALLLVQFD